jgi:hypothetical protein
LAYIEDRYEKCRAFTEERFAQALDALRDSGTELNELLYATEVGDIAKLESIWARGNVHALTSLAGSYPHETYEEQVRWTAARIAGLAIEHALLDGIDSQREAVQRIQQRQREVEASVPPAVYAEAMGAARILLANSKCCKLQRHSRSELPRARQ